MEYQDRVLVNLNCKRTEVDELWSFVEAKEKNVPTDKKNTGTMGDVWTWVGHCSNTFRSLSNASSKLRVLFWWSGFWGW